MSKGQWLLAVYSGAVTAILGVLLLHGLQHSSRQSLEQLTVQRINIVEPDGTLRLVISNHAELPGIIVHGKERAFARPQAGMIFYNDEASEDGGLIFGGHLNSKGEVEDSGGSLSFDKYGANEVVQLIGVDDKDDRMSGLSVTDSLTGDDNRERVWVGRRGDGTATVRLMDGRGRQRIQMQVTADGTPSLSFLDGDGKVLRKLP
ncbi:MAG TPA: hypothetical protein VKC11_12175 [Steroidobacteraceae bacterium]|nr:hypothetical protein [Steroidobacteraceae bacterium]